MNDNDLAIGEMYMQPAALRNPKSRRDPLLATALDWHFSALLLSEICGSPPDVLALAEPQLGEANLVDLIGETVRSRYSIP